MKSKLKIAAIVVALIVGMVLYKEHSDHSPAKKVNLSDVIK